MLWFHCWEHLPRFLQGFGTQRSGSEHSFLHTWVRHKFRKLIFCPCTIRSRIHPTKPFFPHSLPPANTSELVTKEPSQSEDDSLLSTVSVTLFALISTVTECHIPSSSLASPPWSVTDLPPSSNSSLTLPKSRDSNMLAPFIAVARWCNKIPCPMYVRNLTL